MMCVSLQSNNRRVYNNLEDKRQILAIFLQQLALNPPIEEVLATARVRNCRSVTFVLRFSNFLFNYVEIFCYEPLYIYCTFTHQCIVGKMF